MCINYYFWYMKNKVFCKLKGGFLCCKRIIMCKFSDLNFECNIEWDYYEKIFLGLVVVISICFLIFGVNWYENIYR